MSDDYQPSGVEFLLSPFPADVVQQRQGPGGRSFSYIPAEVMIRRLVDSGLEYSFGQVPGSPPEIVQHSNGVNVMMYYGRLHIPALGLPMDDVGTAFIHANGNEEQYKSAASDCLKRCARLYGIGLEMWEGDPNEATRGNPATDYQSGGGVSPTGYDQSRTNPNGGGASGYQTRTGGGSGYGNRSQTQNPAPSNGDMSPAQFGLIQRLARERNMVVDNNEVDDRVLEEVCTFSLGMTPPVNWRHLSKKDASNLIEALIAINPAPQLQV